MAGARLSLAERQWEGCLRLVIGDRDRARESPVDVKTGGVTVKRAHEIGPGIESDRPTRHREHSGSAVQPELPGVIGSGINHPALGVRLTGDHSANGAGPTSGADPPFNRKSRRVQCRGIRHPHRLVRSIEGDRGVGVASQCARLAMGRTEQVGPVMSSDLVERDGPAAFVQSPVAHRMIREHRVPITRRDDRRGRRGGCPGRRGSLEGRRRF